MNATATFSDPTRPAGHSCVEGADPLITSVACGFNVVFHVPVPKEIEQPSTVQSMVPHAVIGAAHSFLPAYWYGLSKSPGSTTLLATVAVPSSVTGRVSIGWDEVTLGSGEVLVPTEEYQFDLVAAK